MVAIVFGKEGFEEGRRYGQGKGIGSGRGARGRGRVAGYLMSFEELWCLWLWVLVLVLL